MRKDIWFPALAALGTVLFVYDVPSFAYRAIVGPAAPASISRDNPLVLLGDAARDGARYRDVETGCEYFLRMTLVVRLDASGKPYCRGGRP